jgi:hypothetical protein
MRKAIYPVLTLQFIARSNGIEPRIRLSIFREGGSAILGIRRSAFAEICQPASDAPHDVVRAFRDSFPALIRPLNQIIAGTPPGGVAYVTAFTLQGRKAAA